MTKRLEAAAYFLGFSPDEVKGFLDAGKVGFPNEDPEFWEAYAIRAMRTLRARIAMDRAKEGSGDIGLNTEP